MRLPTALQIVALCLIAAQLGAAAAAADAAASGRPSSSSSSRRAGQRWLLSRPAGETVNLTRQQFVQVRCTGQSGALHTSNIGRLKFEFFDLDTQLVWTRSD
jgi:hypothetical protein